MDRLRMKKGQTEEEEEESVPLSSSSLFLQVCHLRNTHYV